MYYRPHIDISIHCVWTWRFIIKRRENLKIFAYLKYRMVFDRIWTAFRFDNDRQLLLFRFQLWLVHYHLLGHQQLPWKTKEKLVSTQIIKALQGLKKPWIQHFTEKLTCIFCLCRPPDDCTILKLCICIRFMYVPIFCKEATWMQIGSRKQRGKIFGPLSNFLKNWVENYLWILQFLCK